jgi:predicted nucleic acid-binding protein
MALVLRAEKRKLSQTVKEIFEHMESGSLTIYIPAKVFTEVLYLSARHKISISLADIADYLKKNPNCREFPMSFAVVEATAQITDI